MTNDFNLTQSTVKRSPGERLREDKGTLQERGDEDGSHREVDRPQRHHRHRLERLRPLTATLFTQQRGKHLLGD